jgi:plastocyanin|tara:strand:+ start:1371 stop:1730 length:360 start_codon:yes stop_codon:yes gene_type:complete
MKKVLIFFITLIFFACSDSSDDGYTSDDNSGNNNSDTINLSWTRGTNYVTNIKVGQTITWTWDGGNHNLVSTDGVESFDSGFSSQNGFTFSHTFTIVGTTNYICTPHASDMYGQVNVTN